MLQMQRQARHLLEGCATPCTCATRLTTRQHPAAACEIRRTMPNVGIDISTRTAATSPPLRRRNLHNAWMACVLLKRADRLCRHFSGGPSGESTTGGAPE